MFTAVNNLSAVTGEHVLHSVSSRRPHSADVRLVVQTCSFDTCVCGAVCAFSCNFSPFSVSKQYRRKKYVFVPSRLPAAVLLFCTVVVDLSVLQRMFEVFQSTFSRVTVQFRRVTTEMCNFDAKQSNLCCFDGFRTLYCVNADVSFRNYYNSNFSRLFSKASVTVILLRFA